MNKIFENIPLKVREETANRAYTERPDPHTIFINTELPWPVCKDGKCPWGVIINMLDSSFENKQPFAFQIDSFLLKTGYSSGGQLEDISEWIDRWDQGLISAEQLREDLGV